MKTETVKEVIRDLLSLQKALELGEEEFCGILLGVVVNKSKKGGLRKSELYNSIDKAWEKIK